MIIWKKTKQKLSKLYGWFADEHWIDYWVFVLAGEKVREWAHIDIDCTRTGETLCAPFEKKENKAK